MPSLSPSIFFLRNYILITLSVQPSVGFNWNYAEVTFSLHVYPSKNLLQVLHLGPAKFQN
jgi:hypothetical protein